LRERDTRDKMVRILSATTTSSYLLFLSSLLLLPSPSSPFSPSSSDGSSSCPFFSAPRNPEFVATPVSHEAVGGADIGVGEGLNYDDVRADLRTLLLSSQPEWPSDYHNYGGLFIRLAWHNAGMYYLIHE